MKILMFDTETTGLRPGQICQLSYIVIDNSTKPYKVYGKNFFFSVDYTCTEYVQFEDDDYYYYVKAVPKMTVSSTDVKVQRISARKRSTKVKEHK